MKKRRINKYAKYAIISLLFIISIVLGIYFIGKENKEVTLVNKEQINEEETYSMSLIAVGDALLHPTVYKAAATSSKDEKGYTKYDFNNIFSYIKEIVKDYDLAYYNQETIIGGKNLGLSGYPTFNSPDEIGSDLVKMGFNLVSTANNHSMDKGTRAITYSVDFWKKQENVAMAGMYSSQEERDNIPVYEKNGITYAFLAYTYGTNGIKVPTGKEYMVNVWPMNEGLSVAKDTKYQNYKEQVRKDVESVRDKVDVVIVSMHWGVEYTHTPTAHERDAALFLSELGVDIILGSHPHVIQPVEFIDDTLVFYSFGNLVSSQIGVEKRVEMIGAVTINKTVKDGKTTITLSDVKADLLWDHYGGGTVKVYPFTKLNNSILSGYQNIYETYKKKINPKNDSRIQVGFLE